MMDYSIGEFAKLVGVKEHTLRFYEKEGLIEVKRKGNNVRVYTDADQRWIEFLLHMKGTGMSLADLKQYTQWRFEGDITIAERLDLLKKQKMQVEVELEKFLQNLNVLNRKIELYEGKLNGIKADFKLSLKEPSN